MCSTFSSRVRLAFVSLILVLCASAGAMAQGTALSVTLMTDRGCGSSAVYNIGDPITFSFSTSIDATVTLNRFLPDGTSVTLVANQPVQGGITYQIPGTIGNPPGTRNLTLDAFAGTQTAHAECTYTAQSTTTSTLTATLQTDRGCGPTALYNLGEPITFSYSVSQTALVNLLLIRPDGTSSYLVFNQTVPGGVLQSVPGMIGNPPGQRRLILTATAGSQSTQMECDYTAQATATPLTATLTTNRGCGATALFNPGEAVTYSFSVSQTAQVTLVLVRADGSSVALLSNQAVPGGVPQSITLQVSNVPGQRRVILDATAGTQTAHMECDYTGQSTGGGGGAATLSLNIDRGCGATYQPGSPITITLSASVSTTLSLVIQQPDGSQQIVFANQPVIGGQTYALSGTIGSVTGSLTLILSAAPGTSATPATCGFVIGP